jgi:hypothetical protein
MLLIFFGYWFIMPVMREWRPCKKIDSKYLKHVACSRMDADSGQCNEHCGDCICSIYRFADMNYRDIDNAVGITIAATVSFFAVLITVLAFVFKLIP